MGLFDNLFGTAGGEPPPQDARTMLLQSALALLESGSMGGGLHGLLDRFRQAGLGDLVASWVGTGENLPLSPEQFKQALGDEHLQQIADASGVPPEQAAQHLSELLPELINRLTPGGEVPQGGLGQVGALLGQWLGRH